METSGTYPITFSAIRNALASVSDAKLQRGFQACQGVTGQRVYQCMLLRRFAFSAFLCLASTCSASTADAVKALAAAGREGEGNEKASAAWKVVVQAGPAALPSLLESMGKGHLVADNWLRIAGDAIADASLAKGHPLPLHDVEAFLNDTRNHASARQMAFDLLSKADRSLADRIEPKLLSDPVQELRRGAVQRLIVSAKSMAGDDVIASYRQALNAVRDEDQTNEIAGELKKLGGR